MEIPSYTQDDYAKRFLDGYSIFPDDTRIFHRADCQYDYLAGLSGAQADGNRVLFPGIFASGSQGYFSVETITPQILRLRFWKGSAAFDEQSPMLLPLPQDRPDLQVEDGDAACRIQLANYHIILDKRPFSLKVISPHGETILESETELLVSRLTAPPMGFRRKVGDPSAQDCAFMSWRSRNQDRYYGLGEKFTKFEKTSSRATIWEEDTCGSNTSDMSYKAVPVLFSTAGWGLMLHSSFRSYWEVGTLSYATASMMVEDGKLDLFLMLAPDLKQLIQLYTGLTGRPPMVPKWALGVWMSRAAYPDRATMQAVAERLRQERIPCDVFNMDPSWMVGNYYNQIGVGVCNFEWDERPWPDPVQTFADFAAQGFNLCLWVNPYLPEDSAAYAEAKSQGYLVKTIDGGISRLEFGLAAGIVDFTNPQAKTWWQAKLKHLLNQGASLFKVDFGDRVPENALFYNGRSGREMHNLFVHLYAETVFEAVQAVKGYGLIWRRPGYIGSQRFPGSWGGDTQVTWEGMRGVLRGGLSAAMTGEVFWSHDIGGFVGQVPPPELYIRWAQFGMLSPLTRFHGGSPREPWFYGEQAIATVRHYANLRYRLIPYLLAWAGESVRSGLPLLRPIVLEFQDEPGVDQIDDQYLLGADLLVAPVFQEGARARAVYFPEGSWYALERPVEKVVGPGYRQVAAPLEYLPLYARAGSVIPFYQEAPQHLKEPVPQTWQLDIYPGDSQRHLVIDETGFQLEVNYQCQAGNARLEIKSAPLEIKLRLVDVQPEALGGERAGLVWEAGDGFIQTTLDATRGFDLTFRMPG